MSPKNKVQESCCYFGCESILFSEEFNQLNWKEKMLKRRMNIGRSRPASELPLKQSLGASKWIAMGEKLGCRKRRGDGSHGDAKGTILPMNSFFPSTTTGTREHPPETVVSSNQHGHRREESGHFSKHKIITGTQKLFICRVSTKPINCGTQFSSKPT